MYCRFQYFYSHNRAFKLESIIAQKGFRNKSPDQPHNSLCPTPLITLWRIRRRFDTYYGVLSRHQSEPLMHFLDRRSRPVDLHARVRVCSREIDPSSQKDAVKLEKTKVSRANARTKERSLGNTESGRNTHTRILANSLGIAVKAP